MGRPWHFPVDSKPSLSSFRRENPETTFQSTFYRNCNSMKLARFGGIFLFVALLGYLVYKNTISPAKGRRDADHVPLVHADSCRRGLLFVTYILPILGDAVGTAVISSGEEAAPDPYHKARAKMAVGDYDDAISVFRDIAKEEPNDRRPVAEITNIYLDRLHDPDNAILTLENAAAKNWEDDEDRAFFMFRLVDVLRTHRDDNARAAEILQDIIGRFPESRHSANATHKLRDIDPALLAALFDADEDDRPAAPWGTCTLRATGTWRSSCTERVE